jgi:hypothetical protein
MDAGKRSKRGGSARNRKTVRTLEGDGRWTFSDQQYEKLNLRLLERNGKLDEAITKDYIQVSNGCSAFFFCIGPRGKMPIAMTSPASLTSTRLHAMI